MMTLARSVTGLGAAAVLAASLLATGCGTHAAPGATMAANRGLAARSVQGSVLSSRKPVRPLAHPESAALLRTIGKQMRAHGVNLPAAPVERAEADVATEKAPKAPPKPDEVDALLDMLSSYGYDGDRKHMIASIHDNVYQYVVEDLNENSPYYAPKGWDPDEYARLQAHYFHWLPNFSVPVNSAEDYAAQALMIAQSRQDVRYYVWVSKTTPATWQANGTYCNLPAKGQKPNPTALCGTSDGTPNPNPFANVMAYEPIYTEGLGFNIVKGVGRGGWLADIGLKTRKDNGQQFGVIQDYLEIPPQFLDPIDYGSLVPIPASLLY